MELDNQVENKPARDEHGRLLPGNTANPLGRPKGQSLKEFARSYLMSLPEEEKIAYLEKVGRDTVWKMAEGNPANATDVTSKGEQILVVPAELIAKNVPPSSTEPNS